MIKSGNRPSADQITRLRDIERLFEFGLHSFQKSTTFANMEQNSSNLASRVADIERRLAVIEKRLQGSTTLTTTSISGGKTLSPKEFILERKPSSDVEAVFLLACYAEFVRNLTSFGVEDIRNLFQESRMRVPVNVNEAINKNVTKGLFTIAPQEKNGKKAWIVTLTGEQRFRKKDK
jgi:hypothetical protein